MITSKKGYNVTIKGNICYRCEHKWISKGNKPKVCPKCKSPYWDKPKTKGVNNDY